MSTDGVPQTAGSKIRSRLKTGCVVLILLVGLWGAWCASRPALEPSAVAVAVTKRSIENVLEDGLPAEVRGSIVRSGKGSSGSSGLFGRWRRSHAHSTWVAERGSIPPEDAEDLLDRVALGLRDLVVRNGGSVSAPIRRSPYEGPETKPGGNGGSAGVRVEARSEVRSYGGIVSVHTLHPSQRPPGRGLRTQIDYAAPGGNGGTAKGRLDVWLTRPSVPPEAPYERVTVEMVEGLRAVP